MMTKILILCTGNSCRSQMAEGFLKSLDRELDVHSAGTTPAERVHPKAVQVMREIGVDIGGQRPKSVDDFLDAPFDYVVTVCDNAKETCPVFTGEVKQQIHFGFEDPAQATGTEEEVSVFRRVRDEIRNKFKQFYEQELKRKEV
ncbi:MAG: arsenate reductase ArsC [bacterium]